MYVRNFKLNGKMIFKIVFVILTILILIMFAIGVINIINSNERVTSKSEFSGSIFSILLSSFSMPSFVPCLSSNPLAAILIILSFLSTLIGHYSDSNLSSITLYYVISANKSIVKNKFYDIILMLDSIRNHAECCHFLIIIWAKCTFCLVDLNIILW